MPKPSSVASVVTGTPTATSWANSVADGINAVIGDIYAAGAAGASLAIPWAKLTGIPTTFAPVAHKASHQTGGADALTASQLGGFDRVAAGGTIGTKIFVGTGTPASPAEGDVWVKG